MLKDYKQKISGLVEQKNTFNKEIEFLKGLLGGKVSKEDQQKMDMSNQTALQYLTLLKGLPKEKKEKKKKVKVDRDLNVIVEEKDKFMEKFYPQDKDEEDSPKIKITKEMRRNFDKLELVRESLPSYSQKVMIEAGKDIMRQSYLKDLELHKKLTNMQEITNLPKEDIFL